MKKHLKTNDKKLKLTTLGFTLIELLAVIVVLAIIAVIATPLVLNTIEDSKKGSAKSSGYTYISEVETSLAKYMLKNVETGYAAGKYDVATLTTDLSLSIKGDTPSEGNICIGSNGTITKASLKINGYVVSYDGKETTTTDLEDIEDITCDEEIALVGDPILDKAKTLVYDDTGVCKTDDTTYEYMGGCYIKGASDVNYVWYNGFMWRIMGINSDNTVRLITEESVTALAYGADGMGLTYTTNEGYIHDWLNEYFYKNLNRTKNIIKGGEYFCSETTTDVSSVRTNCENGKVKTKIGLMSLDEYNLSGASSSYLDIGQYYWTMTPYSTSKAVCINSSGGTYGNSVTDIVGVRPVINVDSTSIITAGSGEVTNFFVLGENKNNNITGKLGDIVTSGEYVSLEDKTYRVVSKDNSGVKLILDGYYEETEGTVYTMNYNETTGDNIFTINSGIGAKLNGDVLAWLGLSDSEKIKVETWYQGDDVSYGEVYTKTLNQTSGIDENIKLGLIHAGDILASQSATMTKSKYWTISKYSKDSKVLYINSTGDVNVASPTSTTESIAIRPVVIVKDDLDITSGTGTCNNPYQIA